MCRSGPRHPSAIRHLGELRLFWAVRDVATVYYDHPVHTPAWHTLNIDFANPAEGPSARVAVELTAQSALGVG
jgi:hypothetical protein